MFDEYQHYYYTTKRIKEHCNALLAQAANERLARAVRNKRRPNSLLAGLGARLVRLGTRLETRYGNPVYRPVPADAPYCKNYNC